MNDREQLVREIEGLAEWFDGAIYLVGNQDKAKLLRKAAASIKKTRCQYI